MGVRLGAAFKASSGFLEDGWIVAKPVIDILIFRVGDAFDEIPATGGGCRYGRCMKEYATAVAVVGWESGREDIRNYKADHVQSVVTPPFVGIGKCLRPFGGVRTDVLEFVLEVFETGEVQKADRIKSVSGKEEG